MILEIIRRNPYLIMKLVLRDYLCSLWNEKIWKMKQMVQGKSGKIMTFWRPNSLDSRN